MNKGDTNMIDQWATDWNISPAALIDLRARLVTDTIGSKASTSEAVVQQAIRLEASRRGMRLWRNNNGACVDDTGRMVRYGLGNDSSKVNKHIKSSDLIGITPIQIAGRVLGVFTAIEVKRGGWKYKGTAREKAQLAWLELVTALGGIGKFTASVEDL